MVYLFVLQIIFLNCFLMTSCPFDSNKEPNYEDKFYNPLVSDLKDTGIPVLKINTNNGRSITSKTEWIDASFEILGSHCGFEDLVVDEIKIKGRGNSSWKQYKKPYSIKLGSKSKILGMKKSKRWVLIANYSDKSLLRNYYASYLGNSIYNSTWNPSFESVHLVLNGKYRGVYLLGEQIKIEENRLNIDDISKVGVNEGGFVLEVNEREDEKTNFKTSRGVCISFKDPDEGSDEIRDTVRSIVQNAEDVLYSGNFTDSENGWRKFIDENSVIDWYIVNEFTKNNDANFYCSVYLYFDPADRKLHLGPNWDFDISCGNIDYNGCDDPVGLWIEKSSWVSRMFQDSVFVEKVNMRWNSTKKELHDSINKWIPENALFLQRAADCNFKKWKVLGHYIWPNAADYQIRTTYQSEIDYLISWLNRRFAYLDSVFKADD